MLGLILVVAMSAMVVLIICSYISNSMQLVEVVTRIIVSVISRLAVIIVVSLVMKMIK